MAAYFLSHYNLKNDFPLSLGLRELSSFIVLVSLSQKDYFNPSNYWFELQTLPYKWEVIGGCLPYLEIPSWEQLPRNFILLPVSLICYLNHSVSLKLLWLKMSNDLYSSSLDVHSLIMVVTCHMCIFSENKKFNLSVHYPHFKCSCSWLVALGVLLYLPVSTPRNNFQLSKQP